MNGKYFNNRQAPAQQRRVKNRRDADKLIHSSYTAFLLLGTMALHDQFGFGGTRLGKWIDKMNELKECYEKGLVTVQDLQSMIKNETGLTPQDIKEMDNMYLEKCQQVNRLTCTCEMYERMAKHG
jgi:hypothetical protein|nr:MAG TPA: hypothetical protein [Caudoviricetes sp.]